MTIEDIKTNPVLFAKKYSSAHSRLAESQRKLHTKTNIIVELRAELKRVKTELAILQDKESAKINRTKRMIYDNLLKKIMEAILPHYPSATLQGIKNGGKKNENVEPRFIMYYILRNKYKMSFKQVGKVLGGRDHSTVLHGCAEVVKRMEIYKAYRQTIEKIEDAL